MTKLEFQQKYQKLNIELQLALEETQQRGPDHGMPDVDRIVRVRKAIRKLRHEYRDKKEVNA
jgi:hypothetical protein